MNEWIEGQTMVLIKLNRAQKRQLKSPKRDHGVKIHELKEVPPAGLGNGKVEPRGGANESAQIKRL